MHLQELKAIAAESKSKKWRMDAAAKEKAIQLIANIWTEENADPAETLESFNELQSEAVAEGIGKAWPEMADDRRHLFLSWLPAPISDRALRRLGLVAAAVMETDGLTATDLLCKLLPAARKKMSKEMRQMLRSVLFGDKRIKFENISQPGTPPERVTRVYSSLLDIAFDPASSVSPVTKSRFGLAIRSSMKILRDHDVQTANELETRLANEMKQWPVQLQEQFQRQLALLDPKSEAQNVPEEHTPIQSPEPSRNRPAETPLVQEGAGEVTRWSRLQVELDHRIAGLSKETELLRQFAILLTTLWEQDELLRAELELTKERASQSTERESKAFDTNRILKEELERQTAKASELTRILQNTRDEAEAEKKRLSQQISANAAGRVDEFKTRLGLLLTRLIVDLPQKDVPVSAELGKVLLLQFHQFLEELRHEGIDARPRGAARS
jgi:hypothetical protein